MRPYPIFLILLLVGLSALSQTMKKSCNCPNNDFNSTGKADKTFTFKNGKVIGLCGYIEIENKDTTFSEFILFQCGQRKALGEWDAYQSCKLAKIGDTLVVKELFGLPIAKGFEVKWVPFYITKYYFKGSLLVDTSYFLKDLPRYSSIQIQAVLNQYSKLTKKDMGDKMNEVSLRLFWAYVSGSKEAGKCLENFEKKFGPFDGAISEEFDSLWGTYLLFKRK